MKSLQPIRRLGLLVALAVPLLVAVDCLAEGHNLLQDGFETGESRPAEWSKGAAVPGVRYLWPRQAAEGERSLSLKKTANRYFPIAEWSRVVPLSGAATKLDVAVQVRAQRATKAIVDAQFLDGGGKFLSHEWLIYIGAKDSGDPPATHDWKEYTGSVAIPPNTKQIAIGLQIYGPGQVWFDELTIRVDDADGQADAAAQPTARAEESPATEPNVEPISVAVHEGVTGQYLFTGPSAEVQPPADGFGLVIVLPGGDGSADFHPFVRNIRAHSLGDEFLVAQPLAVKWTPQQETVWPTKKLSADGAKFTTEELVAAVVDDVAAKHKVDRRRVYLLAWSSGGPAAYATLLLKESPAVGGLLAMSVFRPDWLPPLDAAEGRKFYLLHSPDDRVCPYFMAGQAKQQLADAGADVTLVDYQGGHGWHGDVFGNIRAGIEWLDRKK